VIEDGLAPGDLLAGRYRLIDRIGSGGMAIIWRAQDETLDRLVAVKVLDLSLSSDVRLRDLVRREAWAASRLNHPDVASVHDFVHLEAFGMLVMQLVEGDPLADLIAAGPLEWPEAARIALRVASVLDHAHHRGVVHRDVTPDNVVIHADRVTVLDFGIAAKIGEPDEDSTGASFGTPAYVAPERLDGTPAQTATDVYALGIILFEMLTGRVPFKVRGWADVALHHGPPPALKIPGAPPALAPLVARMLAHDPPARPRAAEVVRELRSMLAPAPPRRLALAVAGAAVVVAAVAIWRPWTPAPHPSGAPPVTPTSAVATASPSQLSQPGQPSPSPEPMLTRQDALTLINGIILAGVDGGEIRSDVGLDLQQLARNASTPDHLDDVRLKISTRELEGSVSAGKAAQLRSAVEGLAATML
jgi:serine/threonine protein kinase